MRAGALIGMLTQPVVDFQSEPHYYLPRLVMFGLIIVAVMRKNRS